MSSTGVDIPGKVLQRLSKRCRSQHVAESPIEGQQSEERRANAPTMSDRDPLARATGFEWAIAGILMWFAAVGFVKYVIYRFSQPIELIPIPWDVLADFRFQAFGAVVVVLLAIFALGVKVGIWTANREFRKACLNSGQSKEI